MALKLSVVRKFQRKMNPHDWRPYYAEDCTQCVDAFCHEYSTTREEYRRKKENIRLLQLRVGELEGNILKQARKDPQSIWLRIWAEQLVTVERIIEED